MIFSVENFFGKTSPGRPAGPVRSGTARAGLARALGMAQVPEFPVISCRFCYFPTKTNKGLQEAAPGRPGLRCNPNQNAPEKGPARLRSQNEHLEAAPKLRTPPNLGEIAENGDRRRQET